MDRQIRYLFDETGKNQSNVVEDEKHTLDDVRFKCMTLMHGSFFVHDLFIQQTETRYSLKHNVDYVYSDIDYETSKLTGKIVANVLIIINNKLGRNFTVTYRTVGLPISVINKRTVELLQAPNEGLLSDSYDDVRKRPKGFNPAFHYHYLFDVQKLEYTLFCLEKIRLAILFNETAAIREHMVTIEMIVQSLAQKAVSVFDAQIEIEFEKFRNSFNVNNLDLHLLKNLELISSDTGYSIAANKENFSQKNSLLSMRGFISFKNEIYSRYVGSDFTKLDRVDGVFLPPTYENMFLISVGTTVILDTFSNNVNGGKAFERMLYPTLVRTNSRFYIRKIVNSSDLKYCILVATEHKTYKVFLGKLSKTNAGFLIEWTDLKEPNGVTTSVKEVMKHISNIDNPHKDFKDVIELGSVENLPLATEFDILLDSKERKYITWRLLDRYMRRFLLKIRPNKTEQLVDKEENVMRNFSVVFSNCGKGCTTNDCHVIDTATVTTTLAPLPTTTLPPALNHIGFFMLGNTDQHTVHIDSSTSLSTTTDDGETVDSLMVINEFPTFYDKDGDVKEFDDFSSSWLLGQGWKHFNVFINRYVININGYYPDGYGTYDRYEQTFNNENESPNYERLFFKIVRDNKELDEPFYFRVVFEDIIKYDDVEIINSSEQDYLKTYTCYDYDDLYNPRPVAGLRVGTYENDNIEIHGMQLYLSETDPSAAGYIDITPKQMIHNTEILYRNSYSEEESSENNYQFDTGIARRIRMLVIETNGPEGSDIGVLTGCEFTVACLNYSINSEATISDENGNDQTVYGNRYHNIYSLLNVVPLVFKDSVKHEYCTGYIPS